MKKILLVTSEESFYDNYGAALQAFALKKKLDIEGEVKILKYKGGSFAKNIFIAPFYYTNLFIHKLFKFLFKRKMKQKYPCPDNFINGYKMRLNMFHKFAEDNFNFLNNNRWTWFTLKLLKPKADIYVCGSDQIWNPFLKKGFNDPGYFLQFASKKSKIIAYAPSFGSSSIPITSAKNLNKYLKKFDFISVREKQGQDIINKFTNFKADLLLDPVMLLKPDEWRNFCDGPRLIKEDYLLCYRFSDSNIKSYIENISKRLNLKVVSLPLSRVSYNDSYNKFFNCGPKEFVRLIKDAKIVCTDSFHATVFSILLSVPVCVFSRELYFSGNANMNSRIESLLSELGLDFLYAKPNLEFEDFNIDNVLQVSYDNAHSIINEKRDYSLKCLFNAIRH